QRLPAMLGGTGLVCLASVITLAVAGLGHQGPRSMSPPATGAIIHPGAAQAPVSRLAPASEVTPSASPTEAPATPTPVAATSSPPPPSPPPATPRPRPATVILTPDSTGPVTVHVGTSVLMRLPAYANTTGETPSPADRWRWDPPGSDDHAVLAVVSSSTNPDGSAAGTFRAVAPGRAGVIYAGRDRAPDCWSAAPPATPAPGGCASSTTAGSVLVTVVP
ncbi:MAG TPA: hypothetical protein VGP96_01055, partial [Candidatus Dormibacteraeota bacterium]|nr:hypothetical protein [Candidatus Dormibacteraeota bacterium]